MEFFSMGAELFGVDGQTDIMKLIVVFHIFVNEPTNEYTIKTQYCYRFVS